MRRKTQFLTQCHRMHVSISEEELPRSVFLFLKNNNGGEDFYRLQLKKGYSLDEVEDRILDLREREKQLVAKNKVEWGKLKKCMAQQDGVIVDA